MPLGRPRMWPTSRSQGLSWRSVSSSRCPPLSPTSPAHPYTIDGDGAGDVTATLAPLRGDGIARDMQVHVALLVGGQIQTDGPKCQSVARACRGPASRAAESQSPPVRLTLESECRPSVGGSLLHVDSSVRFLASMGATLDQGRPMSTVRGSSPPIPANPVYAVQQGNMLLSQIGPSRSISGTYLTKDLGS